MGAVVTAAVHEKAEPELVHSGDRLTWMQKLKDAKWKIKNIGLGH